MLPGHTAALGLAGLTEAQTREQTHARALGSHARTRVAYFSEKNPHGQFVHVSLFLYERNAYKK
jgi:hypothetical protein